MIVVFGCQAVVMVCGWPGMFVVVGVACGQRGGRPLWRRWLWDEEGRHVPLCDMCDLGINIQTCVCAIMFGSRSHSNL